MAGGRQWHCVISKPTDCYGETSLTEVAVAALEVIRAVYGKRPVL